jgi:CRP-like cAMP-binding protein
MKLDPSAFIADPELILELQSHASALFCGQDRVLFRQGDRFAGLYILNHGAAILTVSGSADGAAAFIQASPGSVFGLPGLIFNESATHTVIARKGADVSFINREGFDHLVQTNPRLSLLHVLANQVRTLSQATLRSNTSLSQSTVF